MDPAVGIRIHRIIGELAGTNPTPVEVIETAHRLFRNDPCGGTTQASARLRCVTAASVYFQRCHPDRRWALTAVEHRMRRAVADLVWTHRDGRVIVDELKSGDPRPATDDALTDQLTRLAVAGRSEFGDRFVGVRFVPLSAPATMDVFDVVNDRLTVVRTPAGMALR